MMHGRSQGGFTLLELLVTLTVVAIVLLVATPALPDPAAEVGAAEAVRAALAKAAATSARLDMPVAVVFDRDAPAIDIRLGDSLLARRLLPRDSVRVEPAAKVWFMPDGRAAGGPVTLRSRRDAVTLTIDPWSSRVAVVRR